MHELSIAISIVEMTENEVELRGGGVVNAVHLKLGPLAGVVKDALLASYDMAAEGTTLEGSKLIIEEVPLVGYCPGCQTESVLPSIQSLTCPRCDTPISRVVKGRELEVFALEMML